MKRISVLILLCLTLAWVVPANAQIFRGPDSAKRANKAAEKDRKKAAKQREKALKKYAKAQRKAAKQAKQKG
jgi:hypothetical protein